MIVSPATSPSRVLLPGSRLLALRHASETGSVQAARVHSVNKRTGRVAMGKDKNTDGGKHDVGRDGQTGKKAEDIDPSEYGKDK